MIILLFIVFASFFGTFFVFMSIPSRDTRFIKVTISKAEYFKRWVALILCLIVFSCSIYTFLSCEEKAIAGAERVAYLKTNNNKKLTPENTSPIYFDSNTNSYFVLEQNFLNPFSAMERRELDFDKTEKYVEIYNQLVYANPYPYS